MAHLNSYLEYYPTGIGGFQSMLVFGHILMQITRIDWKSEKRNYLYTKVILLMMLLSQ